MHHLHCADFYVCSMQALIHHWQKKNQKSIANGGDYVEKFALSNSITVLFVAIVVSREINRGHYLQSNLCTILASLL